MSQRLLTSRKLRAALYYSQDGLCAICGEPLPDNWHADHIVPYSVTGRTNVHEMQALCPGCNLRKGTKMGLRKHQTELLSILKRIASNASEVRNIGMYVTPGGGKSAVPMIVSSALAEKRGYKICVVVPRDALRRQGEKGFVELENRERYGHLTRIRAVGNVPNPSGDDIGYITTYQAIATNPDLHFQEFLRHKYVLVLDETHHVPDGDDEVDEDDVKASYRTIAPLFEKAVLRILMTGTLARHDGKAIAFWPYSRFPGGARSPVIENTDEHPDWAFIRYRRGDAMRDLAVVELQFEQIDGWAAWKDPITGEDKELGSFENANLDIGAKALRAALATEYASDMLVRCFDHWSDHRAFVYDTAKMLVIAPTIETAHQYTKFLKSLGGHAMIATSRDTPEAIENIERYKKDGQILVTVGMAYEGLDVPSITHVAVLTNIRSRPWIEQCVCRANRAAEGKLHGYIYHPADDRMKAIMEQIEFEQAAVVFDGDWLGRRCVPGSIGQTERLPIIPDASGITRTVGREMGGTMVNHEEYQRIEAIAKEVGIRGASVVQMKQFLERFGVAISVQPVVTDAPVRQHAMLTPSQEESRNRAALGEMVNDIARRTYGSDKTARHELIKQLNSDLKWRFYPGKERKHASGSELTAAIQWINQSYPVTA